ncbi:hypothetical protein FG93_00644 [Bosea sp. LC85]|uniref:hypothetical protein n=1 Tax=Bosea sp. LC85 TaxID=1502851 RepID=UPI0004E2F1F4|nr:hypothetical protein [Bosea sp. LC85]KFC75622.1 hypothetical protein FG93_00644 [Bosea sp. LC85]
MNLNSYVTLYLKDEALILGIKCGFIRTSGKLYENPELWQPLMMLIKEKRITINPLPAAKDDAIMRSLAVKVSSAAAAKLAEMGSVEAIKNSHGPRKQPKGVFPPLKASGEEGDS